MTTTFTASLIGILGATAISVIAWRQRALTTSGAVAAFVVGSILFTLGGWVAAAVLITFFVTGSLFTRLPKKASVQDIDDTSGRNWLQVLANGGVPVLFILLGAVFPAHRAYFQFAYLASIAAATADTWATEFGTRYGGRTRDLLTLTPLPPGLSGGVTYVGLLFSLLGAAAIAAVAAGVGRMTAGEGMVLVGCGFAGSVVDSLLGSTVQGKYECPICGDRVETRRHHGRSTRLLQGSNFVDNNVVNLLAVGISGVLSILLLDFA